jgi:hypothetical protein
MTEQDPHRPTNAGPVPEPAETAPAAMPEPGTVVSGEARPAPEPTPTVPPAGATPGHPAGSALPGGPAVAEVAEQRPEVLVGAAFAGGLVVAMILKRITRGRR